MVFQKGHPFYKGAEKCWFKKGMQPKVHAKKGQHISLSTEFKKGQHNSRKTEFKKGRIPWNKGKKLSKEHRDNLSKAHIGIQARTKHPNWRGGKWVTKDNYILIRKPNHPFANKRGYIFQHRLVMERSLGRYLKPQEVIHHINGDTSDNRIENLMFFPNQISHRKFHFRLKKSP